MPLGTLYPDWRTRTSEQIETNPWWDAPAPACRILLMLAAYADPAMLILSRLFPFFPLLAVKPLSLLPPTAFPTCRLIAFNPLPLLAFVISCRVLKYLCTFIYTYCAKESLTIVQKFFPTQPKIIPLWENVFCSGVVGPSSNRHPDCHRMPLLS